MTEQFDIEVGDVMIVKGKTKSSKLLSLAQKVFYFKNSSSHVLISFADGFYIHSTGDKGVHLISFKELLPEIEPDYKVIRLKCLDEDKINNLRMSITYYLNQNYNKAFFLDGGNTSFCSQLVAKTFNKANITILDNKHHSLVIPADFEREANNQNDWIDITNQTIEKYKEFLSMGRDYDIAYFSLKRIMMLRKQAIKSRNILYEAITKSDLFSEQIKKSYDEMQKELAPKLQALNWDDIHAKYYKDFIHKFRK